MRQYSTPGTFRQNQVYISNMDLPHFTHPCFFFFFFPFYVLPFGPKKKGLGLGDLFGLCFRGLYKILHSYAGQARWWGAGPIKRKTCRERRPGLGSAVDNPPILSNISVSILLDTHIQKTKKKSDEVCSQNGCYCCRKIRSRPHLRPKRSYIYIVIRRNHEYEYAVCARKK